MPWWLNLRHTLRSAQFWWTAIKTSVLILVYYGLSIGLTFYQRQFTQDFHYPLTIVLCHLLIKFILAWLCRIIYEAATSRERPLVEWKSYASQVLPAGAASALDIGLSNWGLELVTVSLYTMTKSTSVIFILGFALLFKLEKKSWSLLLIVTMISIGLIMFTYKSTQFQAVGFLLVLSASFISGLRWTLAQMMMHRSKLGLGNPIDMIYHMQPWMAVTLIPFVVLIEGVSLASTYQAFRFDQWSELAHTVFGILLGASIAFLMEISEFLLIMVTSSLTLSIAGIFKEACTFILAVKYNGDKMSPFNAIGLVICLCGILVHVLNKAITPAKPEKEDEEELFSTDVRMPLLDMGRGVLLVEDAIGQEDLMTTDDDEDVLFNIVNRRELS
ncbi:solute carrier family 35 member C2 [Neocloeon triangulifer]|uniref:solute carrier family 35 member C2 n=1 Tax=Neocloeon triangulifer TaxID=2078957 RepID=UPI00286F783E|nr:solute carrier family 35 member C2 [Neocloeon triangulifer]